MTESSNLIRELKQNANEFIEFVKSDRFKSNLTPRKIMLSNKLDALSKSLTKFEMDETVSNTERMEILNDIQNLLTQAKNCLNIQKQQLAYLETENLIQFLNLRRASLFFFNEKHKVISSASMLAEILIGSKIKKFELPSPDSSDFRRIVAISLNILMNTAGIYEMAIDNLQLVDMGSFVSWSKIVLDAYHEQLKIWEITRDDEVAELYRKGNALATYLQNEIIKAFSLEGLGYMIYLLEILRKYIPNSIFDHPLLMEHEIQSYKDYLDFVLKESIALRERVDHYVLKYSSIRVEDLPTLDNLDLVINLNDLRKKTYHALSISTEELSILILDWYKLLNKIRGKNEITSDWIQSDTGETYLAVFMEFVHLLAIEGQAEPLLVFQERWNGFSELFDIIPISDYPSFVQYITLIEMYVRFSHNDYSHIERHFQTIWRLRNEVELNLTLFVENNILQALLGYYSDMMSTSQIEELLNDLLKLVDEVMPWEKYKNELREYVENVFKAIKGEEHDFNRIIAKRFQIDDLDPVTWLLPDFSGLASATNKTAIPFLPFNRKRDKFYMSPT
ncbi:MAG: hypothetical protein D6732_16035 [Methanobacteriota archaeon]|nr:MAG: hypothetical protein D6732_16035 [Euryarchaeota archaeon]